MFSTISQDEIELWKLFCAPSRLRDSEAHLAIEKRSHV
jgi:hypothetical protein